MSDLRFQKLTPTSNVDLNVYEEGFEFIFSNDDIRNIAVSGPYSSGKSSLLESYKKKYPQKTFIHISLAHFTNENKDNEEKEIEDSETVIEGKILNQLIQQIPIENILAVYDTMILIVASIIVYVAAISKHEIHRKEGVMFLVAYLAFFIYVLLR